MNTHLASSITKAASQQTYYTIRLLADRDRVEDAYRAYAYFRWVDDILDADPVSGSLLGEGGTPGRMVFLERQRSLLESSYQGEPLRDVNEHEKMLVDLVQHDMDEASGLQIYLRNMMRVMDFDANRRGRLISQAELNEYTYWLASAVTEAMHYFIGHGTFSPHNESRYLAVSAAHITHMLRDTFDDLQAGYYNIPREVLRGQQIGLQDVHSDAYRTWVKGRIQLAREYFEAGRAYLARVQNPRCRMAGFSYVARFQWLLDTIEKEGYRLRREYEERKHIRIGLRMSWQAISAMMYLQGAGTLSRPIAQDRRGQL